MKLIYNGVDIGLLGETNVQREAVYDDTGTDFLYTKWTINATGIVNGQVEVLQGREGFRNGPGISYKSGERTYDPNIAPGPTDNPPGQTESFIPRPNFQSKDYGKSFPHPIASQPAVEPLGIASPALPAKRVLEFAPNPTPLTDRAVRMRLQTPRQRLFLFAGEGKSDELILVSPAFESVTDCKNGPIPVVYSIQSATGYEPASMFVQFSVTTYINEVANETRDRPALLSNRWTMRHEIDEDYRLTITVAGTAIFRTDVLYDLQSNPDSLRNELLLPIPQGCKRTDLVVEGMPDMAGVTYSYRDVSQMMNFHAGKDIGATRIELSHRQAIVSDTEFSKSILGGLEGHYNLKWAKNAAAGEDKKQRPGKNSRLIRLGKPAAGDE